MLTRRKFIKRSLLWIPVAPVILRGQGLRLSDQAFLKSVGISSGVSYLVNENCEGAGTPTGWTDSTTGTGSVDWEYATAPAPLEGSQSVYFDSAGGTAMSIFTFADQSELWMKFMCNATPVGNAYSFTIQDSTPATCAAFRFYDTGTIRVYGGTAYGTLTGTMTLGTTYYCWLHYKKGTGADGIADFEFQTTDSRLGSGNNYKQIVNGTATTDAIRIRVGCPSGATGTSIFDTIIGISGATPP